MRTDFQAAKKYNGSFSDWTDVITGVPKGSILVQLLINIFLKGIFIFISKCNFCNYVNDNTLYSTKKNLTPAKKKP